MNRRIALSLVVFTLSTLTWAAPPGNTDLRQPQSPPLPAPDGLKIIDQGQFDPRLKGYYTPAGFRVDIVAEAPTIINPVGMAFGSDGTLYVLEWLPSPGDEWRETPEEFTYKDGSKRKVATMKKKTKDVLKILRWNEEKKLYDKAEVILEDELPSTVLLHDGWIYTASRGTVRRYRQSQPGGKYDVKQVIAQGFCGFHHHQVSGLTIGNDGWLYITSGDDDNYAEGSDGSRSTVLRTGAVFRCRPDGSKLHAYSMGWRNPYRDLAFDTAFNWFHVDNDNEDGSKFTGCRLMHVAEETDFGWRLFTGARCCRPDHVRGAVFGELPGKMPAMLKTGRGSPAGLLIYNDTQLPDEYRGLLYYPDVFRKVIRAYRVLPEGSTFQAVREFEFMKSDDPLFRPCHMITGPDGAIYVCDWRTDSGGAGKLWGDGKNGRIYRMRWAGTDNQPAIALRGMDSWAKVRSYSDTELLAAFGAANFTDRLTAQRELVRRGDKNRPALLKLVADKNAAIDARMLAVGALQSFWNDDVKRAFIGLLRDASYDLVRLAADGLSLNCGSADPEAHAGLVGVIDIADPAAQRAVALALGRIGAPGVEDYLAVALRADKGKDVYLTDGLVRSLERLGPRGIQKLVEFADSGIDRQLDRVVDWFVTLRTRAGVEALPNLLRNPHLKPALRVELIKSFANYLFDPPLGPDLLIEAMSHQANQPAEVKKAGLEMLGMFGTLQNPRFGELLVQWVQDPDPDMRLTAIRTVEQTKLSAAVPVLLNRLTDATWTFQERTAIAKALRVFSEKTITAPMMGIVAYGKSDTPEAAALRLEAFRTIAQLDPTTAQRMAGELIKTDVEDLRAESVQILGTTPAGARQVADLYIAKKLPRDLLPQVTEGLRKHLARDPDLGKLLTDVMKGALLVSLDKAEVSRIQGLVKTKGNAMRGRDLYLNGKTVACINCHKLEGTGGNVGPDLTRVWDTHTVEKIMESMIDPNKEIKEGYQSYRLTTKKGQTYVGLKVIDTPAEVAIREATGKEIKIAKSQVDELEVSKTSLMPDNVISQLTFDQFLDLVSFLKDRSAQESLRGLALDYWLAGPYGKDMAREFEPEQKADHTVKLTSGSWKPVTADPTGYLNIKAALGTEHCTGYALTYVWSPKAQKAQLLAGSDTHMRIWINGAKVHDIAQSRTVKPDLDRVDVSLNSGWNVVLVKMIVSSGPQGLYLRFGEADGLRISTEKK